ncbi:UNVERIFIED_CONTAM: hypothetical protein GTU68_059656 [Idotea baltica]|nr:hypothetical protein [Idotea baltica]
MAVVSDPIADFLIRFKNATRAQKEEFRAPYSKIKAEIARILQEEGYHELTVTVDENVRIKIEGIDKQLVGQFAADVRAYYPPEPYKGKGVRYKDEHVRRKQDDVAGKTIASASTKDGEVGVTGASVAAATKVGETIAKRAKASSIDAAVFDRGGFIYHGKVKALADAAREAGLEF